MNQLDQLEKRFRNLFESNPIWNHAANEKDQIVHELSIALQDLLSEYHSQVQFSKPLFQFNLNPGTAHRWKQQSNWEKPLIALLVSTAAEFGVNFVVTPGIKLISDETLKPEEVVVQLKESVSSYVDQTSALSIEDVASSKTSESNMISCPLLILPGDKIIHLTSSVVNIGRKSTNEIVINDLRISRTHAQIRKTKGGYEIFDTGSTGGTFVNSNRIDQKVLRPGDVISLAGYSMVFTIDQVPVSHPRKFVTSEIKTAGKKEET